MPETLRTALFRIVRVWAALMLMLALTTALAFFPMGGGNFLASMFIALIKASLVILFFMNFIEALASVRLVTLPAIALLGILFALAGVDYLTRIEPFAPWQ